MKPFNRKDWGIFMDSISHLNIQTLESTYNQKGGNIVNIRHDVDDDLPASVAMAMAENKMGIHSTFFILDTSPYWGVDDFGDYVRIVREGHNIGWHNNAISNYLRTGIALKDCIDRPLGILRQFCPVIGTASHGDPLCHQHRYLNYYIFKESLPHPDFPNLQIGNGFKLEDFGLKYEAYHTGHTHYLSDAGGKWNHDPLSYIEQFKLEGGKLQINIHPQWWQL